MSGIFGFINLDGRPASQDCFQPMVEKMASWGPDGLTSAFEGNAAFGHTLLVVTHESRFEKLPYYDADEGILFTAAARLDNRDELCNTFYIPHPERPVTADGQLVLQAYKKWGTDSCKHLFGDWSFAAWHIKEQRLFLARAHLGNTGLFYFFKPPLFVFSSNTTGILAHAQVPHTLDEYHLAQRLILDYSKESLSRTYWKDISFLPAAHRLTHTKENLNIETFWRLDDAPSICLASDDDYLEGFLHHYRRAVRVRLNSIRPVCATLSAGLDSGSVTALAAEELRKMNQSLTAYTSVPMYPSQNLFPGKLTDEWPLAHQVANLYKNIEHIPIRVEDMTILDAIRKSLDITEEPQHAAINMFWIISMLEDAQSRNFGVILRGQLGNGGVSWHGGANYIYYLLADHQWRKSWSSLKEWKNNHEMSWLRTIKSQLIRPYVAPIQFQYNHLISQIKKKNLQYAFACSDFIKRMELNKKDMVMKRMNPLTERTLITRLTATMAGRFWPSMGACHGMEVRDPTADIRLLEFCVGIPNEQYTFSGGERMLIRRAMNGILPDAVRWNKVRGQQAADVTARLINQQADIDKEFLKLDNSEEIKKYLDIEAMKQAWKLIQSEKQTLMLASALLRAINHSFFLLSRFE